MSVPTKRAFDRVLVIMLENQYRSYVLANPYMRQLAKQGRQLGGYFGVMHPSQTNYIASIAGELCNVTSDDRPPLLDQRTVVDLLEEAPGSLRWKAYMDSYVPQATPWMADLVPADAPPYFVKHNPFSSFASIVRSESRWRRIDNEASLFADLLNGELPEYSWFTPNMWNDGHWVAGTQEQSTPRAPGLVDQQAVWLEAFFTRLRFPGPRSHLPPHTLVVVTFDESDFEADYQPDMASAYDGPNQVYTVLLGDDIEPGFEHEGYNHYSLLRTIEKNFGLGHLAKNDADANWFQFLWGRRFQFSPPSPTPLHEAAAFAAAGFQGALFVVTAEASGQTNVRTVADGAWSTAEVVGIDCSGGLALASTYAELVLVGRDAAGELSWLCYDLQHGWSSPTSLPAGPVSSFALSSFDHEQRIMLALSRSDHSVMSLIRSQSAWGDPVAVPSAATDGALVLGVLGASLYLIAKAPDSQQMNMVSYNTASFNGVEIAAGPHGGAQNGTSIGQWSPSAFPVAHFSSRPDEPTAQRQPLTKPYESGGPMVLATLDGVMHLVHPGPANAQLLTETFSIAGLMTPSQPVSYKRGDKSTASNGFGTLAEAGWSRQQPIFGARCETDGALAFGRNGDDVFLLSRPTAGAPVEMRLGRYVRSDTRPNDIADGADSATAER
ncbi:MAG: alkaline phosphatase family protein [Ilumatobacteraceae bacterium]